MPSKLTCFVISGFGPKPDLETGRIIDLDKTFEHLIKPVFDKLDISCFRAKDIRHSGVIDVPMYEWIFKADIVVADVSTLNSNALYELGVRHALRPNTTIVISENQTRYPFDINHIIISKYEHLGKDIGVSEAKRFKKELKKLVKSVLLLKKNDSPVYTYLPNLQPPRFSEAELELIDELPINQVSLSELVQDAEDAKNSNDFRVASLLYKACLKFEPSNSFLIQRLALVTYKSEKPNPQKALLDAERILEPLNPIETTDIETLGLSGAINKRLYELSRKEYHLDKALGFYAKGYHIAEDYYNGINYAYLLTLKATLQSDSNLGITYFTQSQLVREHVVKICTELIGGKQFADRGDREWVYQSLAQAYLGLGRTVELESAIEKITELSNGPFDMDTFNLHNSKLIAYISLVRSKGYSS